MSVRPSNATTDYHYEYVLKHVLRFNHYRQTQNEAAAIDCLWRIASNADRFTTDQLNDFTRHGMPLAVQDAILTWLKGQGFVVECNP